MQTGPDGEYIPEKELDFNFKIPRKRKLSHNNDIVEDVQMQLHHQACNSQVLTNSYYNLPTIPTITQQATVITTAATPAETTIFIPQIFPVNKLEPKKMETNRLLKETIPDVDDETLPKELTSMFQPLYCKLCSAQLSSNVVAKLHYKSKGHEKKLRKFLIDYSENTGKPLHKRAKLSLSKKEQEMNPIYFYCDICDLRMTGKLNAESHYMGKNHRKAVLGQKVSSKKGIYNDEGKFFRQDTRISKITNDSFGMDFHKTEEMELLMNKDTPFRCELCSITTTCREQLESHYIGQKHQKKIKQQLILEGLKLNTSNLFYPPGAALDATEMPTILTSPSNFLQVQSSSNEIKDLSSYRTPSGQYYCQICNVSLNSEIQFKQHLQSKNHLKKIK